MGKLREDLYQICYNELRQTSLLTSAMTKYNQKDHHKSALENNRNNGKGY